MSKKKITITISDYVYYTFAGLEDDVLTTDIIAEEEKLELANDEQEKAWRKEVQDRAKEEEELKEKR